MIFSNLLSKMMNKQAIATTLLQNLEYSSKEFRLSSSAICMIYASAFMDLQVKFDVLAIIYLLYKTDSHLKRHILNHAAAIKVIFFSSSWSSRRPIVQVGRSLYYLAGSKYLLTFGAC